MRAQVVAGAELGELLDPGAAARKAVRSKHLKLEGTPVGLQPTELIRSSEMFGGFDRDPATIEWTRS